MQRSPGSVTAQKVGQLDVFSRSLARVRSLPVVTPGDGAHVCVRHHVARSSRDAQHRVGCQRAHEMFSSSHALDKMLGLAEGVDKGKLEKAMEGHIIGKAAWFGRFHAPPAQ